MKRSRFGAGLLIFLLILGALSAWGMGIWNEPVAQMARQAGQAALAQEWSAAEEQIQGAKALWERRYPFCAAFADHEPMEDINSLFAQLEVYALRRDEVSFGAVCAQLAEDVTAMGEAHSLTWWNLL